MTILLAFIGLGIWLTLVVGFVALIRQTRSNGVKLTRIEAHQLNPRTRIAQAHFDNGPETPEKIGRKLASVSRGQRLVVGGDPESGLHRRLSGLSEAEDE